MASQVPGETRSERKRNHVLAAARDVFAREGFSHAGMEQVARTAGVSTATLYAYFPSKADLFRVVVEEAIEDIADKVRASAFAEGCARERLFGFSLAYAEFYSAPASRALFRMVVAERKRFPDLAEHFRERGRVELAGALLTLMDDLSAAGELTLDKPSWAAGQLQGMLEHATLMVGLVAGDEARPVRALDEIAADAVTTFLARYGA